MKSRSSASTVTSAFQYPVIGPVTRAAANLGPGPKAQSEMCGGAKSPPKIWPSFLSNKSLTYILKSQFHIFKLYHIHTLLLLWLKSITSCSLFFYLGEKYFARKIKIFIFDSCRCHSMFLFFFYVLLASKACLFYKKVFKENL